MARTKKGPDRPATLWEQAEEVPRAGIPDTEKLVRRMKWYRRLIWAVLVVFPVMGLALFVGASSLKAAAETEPVVVEVDTDARAVAMTAVEVWLAGDPAPLPGGRLVSWDEMQILPAYVPGPQDNGTTVAPDLQGHTLTVRAGTMRYRVQVLVAKNRAGELSTIGTPSLLPVAPSSDWSVTVSPWPNHTSTTPSDDVQTAVGAWAEAFTSGDPGKLRLVVGDADSSRAYQPMTGVVGADVTVNGAAWLTDDAGQPTSSMIVQVKVVFRWPDADPRSQAPAGATYDLLVEGAASAAPRVVAWGGAGTGPVLTAYQNAVEGRDLTAVERPEQTASQEGGQAPAPSTAPGVEVELEPDAGEPAPDEVGTEAQP
jgi:hypothetical protein